MTDDKLKHGRRLSQRQLDNLCTAINAGGRDMDIAIALSVSESTVAYYRRKLGLPKVRGKKAEDHIDRYLPQVCMRGGCLNKAARGKRVCEACEAKAAARYTEDQKRHMMAGRA